MTWTKFWDMHSGGGKKLNWDKIYVNLPYVEAVEWFEDTFYRDPFHVSCDCCGDDYSVNEFDSLQQATAYHRGCDFVDGEYVEEPDDIHEEYYGDVVSVEEYREKGYVLVVDDPEDFSP